MPTNICKVCFKPITVQSFTTLFLKNVALCDRCYRALSPKYQQFNVEGVSAFAIYDYDDYIKEKLYLLKGCGDVELAGIFFDRIKIWLHIKYRGFHIVPIPSWYEDDNKRGFNHVETIFSFLRLPMILALRKIVPHKQAMIPFQERHNIKNLFALEQPQLLINKRILLVDDVYTSGTSMKQAYELVKKADVKEVKILVMSKTKTTIK